MKEQFLSISEAARQLGVESHVLRYWEEELEIPVPRNEMGYRFYGAKQMHLLHTVKELKTQGFQLRSIRFLLSKMNHDEEVNIDNILSMRDEINQKANQLDNIQPGANQQASRLNGMQSGVNQKASQLDSTQPGVNQQASRLNGMQPGVNQQASQ